MKSPLVLLAIILSFCQLSFGQAISRLPSFTDSIRIADVMPIVHFDTPSDSTFKVSISQLANYFKGTSIPTFNEVVKKGKSTNQPHVLFNDRYGNNGVDVSCDTNTGIGQISLFSKYAGSTGRYQSQFDAYGSISGYKCAGFDGSDTTANHNYIQVLFPSNLFGSDYVQRFPYGSGYIMLTDDTSGAELWRKDTSMGLLQIENRSPNQSLVYNYKMGAAGLFSGDLSGSGFRDSSSALFGNSIYMAAFTQTGPTTGDVLLNVDQSDGEMGYGRNSGIGASYINAGVGTYNSLTFGGDSGILFQYNPSGVTYRMVGIDNIIHTLSFNSDYTNQNVGYEFPPVTGMFPVSVNGVNTNFSTGNISLDSTSFPYFVTNHQFSSSWKISGNSGTDPNTNFIGTSDGTQVYFKSRINDRNQSSLQLTSASPTASGVIELNLIDSFNNAFQQLSMSSAGVVLYDANYNQDTTLDIVIDRTVQRVSVIGTSYGYNLPKTTPSSNQVMAYDGTSTSGQRNLTWQTIQSLLATIFATGYANDTLAALGGIAIGDFYYNTSSNALVKRLS